MASMTDIQASGPQTQLAPNEKPVVVGIYGVPGSGKTTLLNQLKGELGQEYFEFYEGSEVIASVVPGGLDVFQKMLKEEKMRWRQVAISKIGKECTGSGRVGVVAGHFMFWQEEEETGTTVFTQKDGETFTYIIYLDIPAEVIFQYRLNETRRTRPSTSVGHLIRWQWTEKTQLRDFCRDHGILFIAISDKVTLLRKVLPLVHDLRHHTEKYNLSLATSALDKALSVDQSQLETVLVVDADRTLAVQDTGTLFWKRLFLSRDLGDEQLPLKKLFSGPLGYTYIAFRQAVLLYEEMTNDQEFDALCQEVASEVTMYPEFVSLLQVVAEQEHVYAVVVTCGLRRIWEKVLEKEGFSKTVKVVGGGRISDGFVVTADVKTKLVARLQDVHHKYVWAFGDSPLDLYMLLRANRGIVVVGEEKTRSKTMDTALISLIDNKGMRLRQVVLPSHVSLRLDTTKLPLVQLTDVALINSILNPRRRVKPIQVLHATERKAVKLLMTPMRDATFSGSALREAHRRVGWYLATEFLADLIGVEEYPIPHVQGHQTTGYRLLHEQKTSIVALMRGGEPMAFGVSEAFPLAMFIHANLPEEVMLHHIHGQVTVMLVDSVVNSGKTVAQFVQRIRKLHATIRIVVVSGVAQAESVFGGSLSHALAGCTNISLIALRLSDNKFTGRGFTDTGNRLFNTTHLA